MTDSRDSRPVTASEIWHRVLALQEQLGAVKPLYAELDALVLDLVRLGERSFANANGETYELRDNFAETNVVFRPAGVKRFEVYADKPKARKKAA